METETQLLLAKRLGYIASKDLEILMEECQEIGKMITGFQKALNNR